MTSLTVHFARIDPCFLGVQSPVTRGRPELAQHQYVPKRLDFVRKL